MHQIIFSLPFITSLDGISPFFVFALLNFFNYFAHWLYPIVPEAGALEGNVGFGRSGYLNGWNYFRIGGMYQHHFPIGDIEGFKWYVGGGAFLQFNSYPDYFDSFDYSRTGLGINGVGGVDYKFKNIPLNLSADWMPTVYVGNYYQSFGGGYGAVSVRYVLR